MKSRIVKSNSDKALALVEVADKPEPSEAETENIRRKFYQAHVGPK